MRVTIRDVAQACGCSITTVSLVMNNKNNGVSSATRERVWRAARELNYRPNQLAVSMVTNRSNVLGLIIPDNENPFFAGLSKSVERAARRAGYSLIYGNSDNNPERDIAYIDMFADHRADGIIFTQSIDSHSTKSDHVLRRAAKAGIPLITLDRQIDDGETPTVRVNHTRGGYLATRHLLVLGHRRIGCYTGPLGLAGADDRVQGYRQALYEMGLEPDGGLLFEGNYQMGGGEEALLHFLNAGASAVFACNDLMAYDLYQAARHFNLMIPEDFSLVGFDDVWFSDIIHPRLTTVHQPVGEIGKRAVAMLDGLVSGRKTELTQVLEPTLVLRDSTAKPKMEK